MNSITSYPMERVVVCKASAALVLFLILVMNSVHSYSQNKKMSVGLSFNIKADTTKVRVYKFGAAKETSVKTLVLKMDYGNSRIMNYKEAKVLEELGCNILSVDIVYSNYEKKEVQNKLNTKRLVELYFLNPDIFKQSMTQWNFIEQLGYTSIDDAKKLFHGVIVKYVKVAYYKPLTEKSMHESVTKKATDTSYFSVFKRLFKGENELVAVDLTGSMSPYYLQVLNWLFLKNTSKTLNYSFFNDGDATPDMMKKTGNTGGVYLCNTNSIDTVVRYAYSCIKGGNGGDTPENNIEAIIKGIKKYPNTKQVTILVDNWSDMRDYSLISEIKVPVKVIVCGLNINGYAIAVNPQYLDLAKKTSGSIHTIEEDLVDLAKVKEGEEIMFGGKKYIFKGGRFAIKS